MPIKMQMIFRGHPVVTDRNMNHSVRRRIASFIEGSIDEHPPGFITRGGMVHLCQLTNEININLQTSFDMNTEVVVRIMPSEKQILAEVFPRQESLKTPESFLVIDGICIHYAGKKLVSQASDTQAKEEAENQAKRMEEKEIELWLLGERSELPDPIKRPVKAMGVIDICKFKGKMVKIIVDPLLHGFKADIFFFKKKDGRRIAVVEINDFEINEEFTLPGKTIP